LGEMMAAQKATVGLAKGSRGQLRGRTPSMALRRGCDAPGADSVGSGVMTDPTGRKDDIRGAGQVIYIAEDIASAAISLVCCPRYSHH
jgi:hypothetical protein